MLKFKKDDRFYHIHEQHNLFGGITVVSSWGTFDSKRGGHKKIFCDTQIEVNKTIENY